MSHSHRVFAVYLLCIYARGVCALQHVFLVLNAKSQFIENGFSYLSLGSVIIFLLLITRGLKVISMGVRVVSRDCFVLNYMYIR